MDNMILDELGSFDQGTHQASVFWDFNAKRVFDRPNRGERMNGGAHPTDTLGEYPGFTWITTNQDLLDAAEHGAGTPGILHKTSLDLCFDPQVSFNARQGVNNNTLRRR